MFRKALILASVLMLCLTAACAVPTVANAGNASSGTTLSQITDPSSLSVTDKLGIGILSLDEAGLSITSTQAADLIPLWQAVQTLGADKTSASAEISALYTQIQNTLTPDQLAQIEETTWSQEELVSLLQQHQSQASQTSATVKSTSSSSSSSQTQNMGGGPGGDMMPAEAGIIMGGGSSMGLAAGGSTTSTTQQSLIASQSSANSTPDLNVLVANAVINLLQQRVDA